MVPGGVNLPVAARLELLRTWPPRIVPRSARDRALKVSMNAFTAFSSSSCTPSATAATQNRLPML
jgi:hypothetical protein